MKLVRYEYVTIEQHSEADINEEMIKFVQEQISVEYPDLVVTEDMIATVWSDYTDENRASYERYPIFKRDYDMLWALHNAINEYISMLDNVTNDDCDIDYTSRSIGFDDGSDFSFGDQAYNSGYMGKVLGW